MRKSIIVFVFLVSIVFSLQAEDTLVFRRHFIIALDISRPFLRGVGSTPDYKNLLINLFENNLEDISETPESNTYNLISERDKNIYFFDKEHDEISFFHFGIARTEFDSLRKYAATNRKAIVQKFVGTFIKDKRWEWHRFKRNNGSIKAYLDSLFVIASIPQDFGPGVTLSNFVYPAIITKVKNQNYAEEYILILLSDFLSGSEFGNKQDFLRIKEVFSFRDTLSPVLIKENLDRLESKFFTLKYFDIAITPASHPQKDQGVKLGIIANKIMPQTGYFKSESTSLFIDSDLDFSQRKFKGKSFDISETFVKFTHNAKVNTNGLNLMIDLINNESQTLFNEKIAFKEEENWGSNYSSDDKLLSFDKKRLTYYIPELENLQLNTLLSKKNIHPLLLKYDFYTNYFFESNKSLNYIFRAERTVMPNNIYFKSETSFIIMSYIIPVLGILVVILILIFIGRPKNVVGKLNGFLDNIEIVNYKKHGKLLTDYHHFSSDEPEFLLLEGSMDYFFRHYIFNWKPRLKAEILNSNLPVGFTIFLKEDSESLKEYYSGQRLILTKKKNFRILIGLKKQDSFINIEEPILADFSIGLLIKESRLGIKRTIRKTVDYNFHIGPKLNDIWVGFDPGTTGSCIAAANQGSDIIIEKTDRGRKEKIMPSLLSFDITQTISNSSNVFEALTQDTYKFGEDAVQRSDLEKKFQSVKKLLGFINKKEISFPNRSIFLNGQELTALLLNGMYTDLKQYLVKKKDELPRDLFVEDNKFDAKRAVVAIPNNFTISKIQDIVDSFSFLKNENNEKQFQEIRYIHEAEAILFFYLSKYKFYNEGSLQPNNDTVLVYDMGGATINATLLKVRFSTSTKMYYIDILGKIGYGIGGDTIDYTLIKFVFEFLNDYPALTGINNPFRNKKTRPIYQKIALALKLIIIENFNKKAKNLIQPIEIQDIFNKEFNDPNNKLIVAVGATLKVEPNDRMFQYFVKDKTGNYPLFEHHLFTKLIYGNVKDSITELLDLTGMNHVDSAIFAGRSSFFPNIKETVNHVLNIRGIHSINNIELGITESKTAVAKGAAWYGVNKSGIRLNNTKTSSSFGIKQSLSGDREDVKFVNLINMGSPFQRFDGELGTVSGHELIKDEFDFDNNRVNFYQVMGKNAAKILMNNEKHKINKVSTININRKTESVSMEVSENDTVLCKVETISNEVVGSNGVILDQEIAEANEEHYTWIVE